MFYKCRHGDWSERSMFYLKREVEQTVETWEKLVVAGDEHELAVFIGTEILRLRKVEEHTSLCSEWDKREAQMILNKRTSDQDERLEEILSRLRTLGWGAEVDFVETYGHTTFFKHKQFRVAERLTEDAWNSMRVGMERCMKNIRFQRLEHELEQRLQARQGVFKDALLALLNHPQNVAHIRLGDIALIPEVREVMCSPADVTVTKDSFDAAAAQMQKHSKEFQRRVQDELLGLLSKLVKEDAKSDADPKAAALQDEKLSGAKVLGLATTCFLCTKCGRGQFYPSVLKHACLRKQPPIVETSDIYGQFVARTIPLYWSGELPVKVMGVLKACEPHACVAKAFELCGKDSRTVTMKEMDALPDLRFVVGERTVLTWRAVVLGMFKLWRFKDPDPAWRLATPEEVVEVKKEERAERLKASRFTCKLCDNLKEAASGQAIYHLTITHGMNNCQRDCDELESYLPRDTPEANNIYVVDLRIKQIP
ncbi:hypothetical protein FOMPIDRAFT_89848 [Fomitopsis schrenkii]|uniref:Uncharacterized protein n=1 Tax=Fomitopsis schrenkii TaxID=2126942 RepID=S8DRH8_FOMSC|nr:hypothetical protein FOMPIDRAFT_89848 [Fomitopsis schrenkii]